MDEPKLLDKASKSFPSSDYRLNNMHLHGLFIGACDCRLLCL